MEPKSSSPNGGLRRYDSSSFWDSWYANQNDNTPVEWSAQLNEDVIARIKIVLDKLPEVQDGNKHSICELGCGNSSFTIMLRDMGYEVVGVDFSQEVITANRLRHPKIRWECADALQLSKVFEPGSFDCIIGKTLLDCFMTRRDAASSIRTLLEQCHQVLKPDHGRCIFLDKCNAYHIIGRGRAEKIKTNMSRSMNLHIMKVAGQQGNSPDKAVAEPDVNQWELDLPALDGHLVTRTSSGSGVLVVYTVDGVAADTGLKSGDQLVGFDRQDGKGMQIGKPREMAHELKAGPLRVLVERPPPAPLASPDPLDRVTKEVQNKRLSSRRSSSQTDHLRRLQRARMITSGSVPNLNPKQLKPDLRISEATLAGADLFV